VFGRELTRNRAQGNGFGGRFTFAPINESGSILHLGISAVDYDAELGSAGPNTDNAAQLAVAPDADLTGKKLIDTSKFLDADRLRTIGLEGAWVHGPFKLQTEYMTTEVSRKSNPDFTGDSWYAYGVWNITGETWGYKGGVLTTPLPNNPAGGMWQLGLRYDHADLNDGLVYGGKESNWTLGVNWYWRSNFKFALNYVSVSSEKGLIPVNDDPNIVELRGQIYW
jgi:phosphate-selective porin OprO/OprP